METTVPIFSTFHSLLLLLNASMLGGGKYPVALTRVEDTFVAYYQPSAAIKTG